MPTRLPSRASTARCPRRPAISAEPWPSSHRRHCAARDHWAHAPVCPSVSAPFLRPRLLSPICIAPAATPPVSPSLALRRQRGPGWQESRRMHPFFAECAKKAPRWQYLREMHASRDQNGKILALCVHFQAQSGDSGCMARESCHQGSLFASRAWKSYMTRRCCQRCPTFRGASPRVAGPRTGRTGFAPCGPGLVRLPHARVSARPAATRARGPSPIAAIRTSAPHPIAAVTHAAAFIAAALHVAPAVPTMPPVTSFIAVGGEPPIGRFPRTPASRRPAARAPPRFPQFP